MSVENGFLNKLIQMITKICWIIIHWASKFQKTNSNKIPDLSPTEDAQNAEEYIDRLHEMLEKRGETVKEIAITAPYSGGKSSLINTFIKRHPNNKYTCISLAAFKDTDSSVKQAGKAGSETDESKSEQDVSRNHDENINKIEKSIVQQILYRTDSSSTPNSRFRRIYPAPLTNSHALTTAIFVVTWLFILAAFKYVPSFKLNSLAESIFNFPNLTNLNLWLLTYFVSLPILIIRDGYKLVHKQKLTKLNLIKGDIAFESNSNDSVFNIYLEEIIYYFSTSRSNVVIFEDLDRFERTDIFIKLKELNKLINDSRDVKQNVRFIYALRDDVFEGKNRTKFFDSIIPVIPIINTANSYPQIKQLLENAELLRDLSDEYLRDISVYVDDMRILKNIVAEYSIYKNTLTSKLKDINLEKLFSFMIYKNIYCDDFAKLNEGQGMLAELFDNVSHIKKKREIKLTAKLKSIEQTVLDSERELTSSLMELNAFYLLSVMKKIGGIHGISDINGRSIFDIPKQECFEQVCQINNSVMYKFHSNAGQNHASFNFDSLMDDMVPPYSVRKDRILNKSSAQRSELNNEIGTLRQQLNSNRNLSLRELALSENREELFKEASDKSLLIHLVEKGYVDKDYHVYMSHFIEGGMTKNDMEFVMSVKNSKPLDRAFSINNCEETMKYLTTDDEYRSIAFFNYDIVSYLVSCERYYPLRVQINKAIKESPDAFSLINESLSYIKDIASWLRIVCGEWEGIWSDIVSTSNMLFSEKNELLVKSFIHLDLNLNGEMFKNSANKVSLSKYINHNEAISEYFPVEESDRDKLFTVFDHLEVTFQTLSGCEEQASFVSYVLKHMMFEVNIENLKIILKNLGWIETESINYSDLLQIEEADFARLMGSRQEQFARMIALGRISLENESDLITLLNSEQVSEDTKTKLIETVDVQISMVKELIDSQKVLVQLIINRKVSPNWQNTTYLLKSEQINEELLVSYLSDKDSMEKLCSEEYEFVDEEYEDIANFITRDEISLDVFAAYFNCLAPIYTSDQFENISIEKLRFLISEKKVPIDLQSYNVLRSIDNSLSNLLLSKSYSLFVNKGVLQEELTLDSDDFYSLLAEESLSRESKISLINSRIELIDLSLSYKDLVPLLVPTSLPANYKPDTSIPQLPLEKLRELLGAIDDSSQRKEVFSWQLQYLDEAIITDLLSSFEKDFYELPESKSSILVASTDENQTLAQALEYHHYISSFTIKESAFFGPTKIKINVKRSK